MSIELPDRINNYTSEIEQIFDKYTDLLINLIIVNKIVLKDNQSFSFYSYAFSKLAKKRFRKMYSDIYNSLKQSIIKEWNVSNKKNDELVKKIKLFKDRERFFKRNDDSLNAFFERKREGLNLSQRVWNLTTQFRKELELSIDTSIREGKSAQLLSKEIKKYLNEPDKLFRKIKDQNNKYTLSKAAKEYHPGQGVYRSSSKNALRVLRTEINIANKIADIERWQTLPFVVGYEVKRSKNKYFCSVCDSLKGKYPKSFKFPGWHPQCLCFIVPILMNHEEMLKLNEYLIKGKEINWKSKNEVEELPSNFLQWIKENTERISTAKSLPYFIRDNKSFLSVC